MSGPPHALVLASAGTGKTYRLVEQLLRLLLGGIEPERVLATTFTRKAAGEILDRVHERLLLAVEKPAELAKLRALAPRGELSREECIALLARLARRPDRLQARTLDSFFVAVARLFALELDLPADWKIAETVEDDALRTEAVGRVLAVLPPEVRIGLLRALHRESASRSVYDALLRVVREGLEAFQESAAEAWRGFDGGRLLDDEGLHAFSERLAAIEPPRTGSGGPFKHWRDNLDNAKEAMASGNAKGFVALGLVRKVIAGEATFSQREIDEETRAVLGALAAHAGAKLLGLAAAETAAWRSFLERFDAAYRALKRERGLYRFDDLPIALHDASSDSLLLDRASDLWFRLDARLDHLLFDEFQDTAPCQWRTLEPLAAEVLADGTGNRSLFCVGDVKQSIYGWRAADPRLLEGLSARYPILGEGERLTKSWRSSPVVLDTVRRVFERIGSLELFSASERIGWPAAAARWQARFAACTAATPLPGDAVLLEARRQDDESEEDAALRLAVERVAALGAGSPASIGVLVRNNQPIARFLYELKKRGILASGEGGNALTDAESVQIFLSALHLADHPDDTAAAFHVETSPLAAALGFESGRKRADIARELRARLVREGTGRVAESLLPAVAAAPEWSAWDQRRFRQLVDVAHVHEDRASLRPEDFARLVRKTRAEDERASRVRVMTIHKSKGLEFDVVVLPELGASLARSDGALLSSRSDAYGPIERVSPRPSDSLVRFAPELAALVEAANARDLEESLCVLYVAMTRARRRLEMIVPPPPKSGSTSKSFANLLREALGAGEPGEDGVCWRHPEASDAWDRDIALPSETTPPIEERPLSLSPARSPRALPMRSASATETVEPTAERLLRAAPVLAISRGTLVHRWLEACRWLEDFCIADADFLALAEREGFDAETRSSTLVLLRKALDRPPIRALLSRPPSGSWRVETERAFSLVLPDETGAEELWTGSIDRLVLQLQSDRVVAAEVIDYKTDDVSASKLDEAVAFHRPQLEAYRRIAVAMTGLPAAKIRARLAILAPGEVREL